MSYHRFLELTLREKAGEFSAGDRAELRQFLIDNPGYYELSAMTDQFYRLPLSEINELDPGYLQKRWDFLRNRTTRIKTRPRQYIVKPGNGRVRSLYIMGASVAAILILTFFLLNRQDFVTRDVIVTTKMGSKTSMKLPDGSTVWLNAGSKISYGKDFGKTSRDVKLSGEAYFDVAHDADRPFVVHTNDFDIKVLGTAFNVKAYMADKESQATLVRGLIELSLKKEDSRKIILKPNEKFTFKKAEKIIKENMQTVVSMPEVKITGVEKPFNDSITIETQWLHNCLAFSDSKLKDIALQITRWYGVAVEIRDEQLEDKEFSGLFKDESVDQVMQALKLAGGFDYIINKNKITIVSLLPKKMYMEKSS